MYFHIFIFGLLFLATTRPTTAQLWINGYACYNGNPIIRQTLSSDGVLTQVMLIENTISDIGQNGSIVVLNNTLSGTTRVIEVIEAGRGASKEITMTKNLQLTIHGWSRMSVTEEAFCLKMINGNINWHNIIFGPGMRITTSTMAPIRA